jgi:hypothetical protein
MLFIFDLTLAKRAMSMAKAMRVRRAPRKESKDATRVTVRWVDKESAKANRIIAAAMGWMISPRVQELPITWPPTSVE